MANKEEPIIKHHHGNEGKWVWNEIKSRKKEPNFAGNFVTKVTLHFLDPEGKICRYDHPTYGAYDFDLREVAWIIKKAEQIFGIPVAVKDDIRELVDAES